MQVKTVTIRTLDDFLAVPSDQLRHCLNAFRSKIVQAKMARLDSEKSKLGVHAPFDAFEWSPHVSSRSHDISLRPDTPLNELDIRPSAVVRMKELKLYCLEDCAEASQNELLRTEDIGRGTVPKIREYLNAVGLDFRENPHPVGAAHDRARVYRLQPLANRSQSITAGSEVAMLGLSTSALNACFRLKVMTVGDLLRFTTFDYISFGPSTKLEIAKALRAADLTLESLPSELELWRSGMLPLADMTFPGPADPALNLQPWIGACVKRFAAAGLDSVALVSQAAAEGRLMVPGVGKSTAERVGAFFKARNRGDTHNSASLDFFIKPTAV